jgi:hypothetical protein
MALCLIGAGAPGRADTVKASRSIHPAGSDTAPSQGRAPSPSARASRGSPWRTAGAATSVRWAMAPKPAGISRANRSSVTSARWASVDRSTGCARSRSSSPGIRPLPTPPGAWGRRQQGSSRTAGRGNHGGQAERSDRRPGRAGGERNPPTGLHPRVSGALGGCRVEPLAGGQDRQLRDDPHGGWALSVDRVHRQPRERQGLSPRGTGASALQT